jgi:hypothetical protein
MRKMTNLFFLPFFGISKASPGSGVRPTLECHVFSIELTWIWLGWGELNLECLERIGENSEN